MKLTSEEVRHIAHLARLKLSEEEVEKFSTQLTGILQWMEMLKEVDTDGVEETCQVTGLENVLREDSVKCDLIPGDVFERRDALLACTELPVERKQIRVPSVL
ncbi:MAG: Asp-tRNA(Asn)/Glu-tRNA(Gln) amidotransferase subunit GatC [Candidatus Peregrinibacteria bacterium]|nr:Asp-tRNA(Asn)/Glu-tRNA(Gln) amidotransferase subunit GatC [Candidatus Peregrinibacteria bacterium]